ncbi:winged helix-turn-helix transcriptional regulator [Actinoplanes aureus]|uniref:Helix-turn-helix transcriptional regulator n=1 Tax=Actinoplanes aureus TaxID=2792083 RepID=A0A931C811_9ACTN|nr:helix-turn-helix domain-containing protein [Actinoplanes aureus]MBG0563884.1 helix-turn-helix transcriptional regulator [Actinoplanes aureus]
MAPITDLRLDRDTTNCSIARTLEVVGEKWTLLVLREIWYGVSRFSDLHKMLGCPRNLLAERLRKLVEHGILATETYQEDGARSRSRYVVTAKGNDLAPAVLGLLQWGDKYRADPAGPAVINHHRDCGAPLTVQVRCARDHHVPAAEVEVGPGPGFRTKAAPERAT